MHKFTIKNTYLIHNDRKAFINNNKQICIVFNKTFGDHVDVWMVYITMYNIRDGSDVRFCASADADF